jgi:hypothetical protein
MGIYDFFMMLAHNQTYYETHGYGSKVVDYFTNYPIYFMIFWIVNLLAGFLSPVLLMLKDIRSKYLALVSAIADTILLILTFTFRNRWDVLGSGVAAFDFFILAITFGLYFYCRYVFKRNA